jgi:hypothetical protein
MTIPDVGRCLGSGQPPSEGTEEPSATGRTTGRCVVCSGRFDVEGGRLVEHGSAPDSERESGQHDS